MDFKDNYKYLSGWIHDYYCDKDGSELIFDINNDTYFECPICHYKYKDAKRKRAWITKYRYNIFSQLEKFSEEYVKNKNNDYLIFIKEVLNYYSNNYKNFSIHYKNGKIYDSYINELNMCGKITAQGLNEAMISIQIANCMDNVNKYLDDDTKRLVYEKLFKEIYKLLNPQITRIHNIDCYEICAIGIIGIISKDNEMINFAFNSKFSFYQQLESGITKDYFWFEGSFHYHLFILKPILQLLKIAKKHSFDISEKYYSIVKEMLIQCFKCSFSDCSLPSPNDGWPNRSLLDYIEVFKLGNEVFKNEFSNMITSINNKNNLLGTYHLLNTGFSILKNQNWNTFIKYSGNNVSHAHPDKLNIEIKIGNNFLTHDLSTSGYGSSISKEYYKRTYSHNTIIIGNNDQNLDCKSTITEHSDNKIKVTVKNLYTNATITRSIELLSNRLFDVINVNYYGNDNVDYIFHCDAELITNFKYKIIKSFKEYPYFKDIIEVMPDTNNISLNWKLNDKILYSDIDLKNKKLFICSSPDNPNIKDRITLIIRSVNVSNIEFKVNWELN